MDIKLIAIDLDDTLLNDNLEITDKNMKALKEAEDKGVIVVLASGRSPFAMQKYVKKLGLDNRKGYKISFNGSAIIRTDTYEKIYIKKLEVNLAKEIYKVVNKMNFPIQTYIDDTIYVSFENKYTDIDCELTGMKKEIIDNYEEFLNDAPVKFVIPGNPEKLIELELILKEKFKDKANIFISKPYFLEVMNINVDKGYALEYLMKLMNIEKNNVMAIGDAMNDYGMINFAGTGVAMVNAIDEIKNIANTITTKNNNESGVAEIVNKYI